MRAIFCLGTRDSNYRSSLSEVRTKKLLSAYDVVLNERHFSDVLEENLTCTWDVWLKASSLAHVVKKLIRSVEERPYVVKDKPFKTPHTLIAFYWHGSDRHGRLQNICEKSSNGSSKLLKRRDLKLRET